MVFYLRQALLLKINPNFLNLQNSGLSAPELEKLKEDGFVEFDDEGLTVTKLGLNFIRNICKAFDLHLLRNEVKNEKPQFSKAI